MTARQIWKSLDRGRREELALALWEDPRLDRLERSAALAPWLTARGLRASYLAKLPRQRRAALLAEGGLPEETASQILMSFHLTHRRDMLGRFLDLLGIAHDQGVISDADEVEPPSREKVKQAVAALRKEFPGADVDLYLRTLLSSDPLAWEAVADEVEALS
ncbi:MAG: hypothetical protein Q9Q40_10725 [Acidobacteriota bacterium]|nr:hypothetical protein [Acidobacteriota bacterium]MDQ7088037.1 hypothetical protein [Acidobacteriota bacterium]